jgi:hypothetical protein
MTKITPEIIGLVTTTICKIGDIVEINGTDYPIERITQQSED